MNSTAKRSLFPFLLALSIFMASSFRIASIHIPSPFISPDKLIHFLVFGLLAIAICRCSKKEKPSYRMAIFAIAITSLYGISDEFHQACTPGRYFEYYDMLADSLGAITAVSLYCLLAFFRRFLEFPIYSNRAKNKFR